MESQSTPDVSGAAPVEAKIVVLDATSSVVTWMNESAAADLPTGQTGIGRPVEEAVPLASALELPPAIAEVRATGKPIHRRIALVSTAKGSLYVVASVYRLPSREVLIVQDRGFEAQAASGRSDAAVRGARGRR